MLCLYSISDSSLVSETKGTNNMTYKDTITTWRWRIVKAGHNTVSFAKLCDISQPLLSQYLRGKAVPSLGRFDEIEKTLKNLGV